jgi:hypothetical protein
MSRGEAEYRVPWLMTGGGVGDVIVPCDTYEEAFAVGCVGVG